MISYMILPMGAAATLVLMALAFLGPSTGKARARRIDSIRDRHAGGDAAAAQAQMRRIQTQQATRLDGYVTQLLPNPDRLRLRLVMTGRTWTLGQYGMVCAGLTAVVAALLLLKGAPVMLVIFGSLAVGLGLPHKAISILISKRVNKFTQHFPDAIELLVRGLRSGLPITETMNVVGAEVPGPVGVEFRLIGDRIRIGRTMDAALQETADRLGTPEFQFFTITLAIQRETGGNLAETLANLADVLRKRAQMKLKVRAMSSESKASAWIIGVLPFLVFGIIHWEIPEYMDKFFYDPRLEITGLGALLWMSIGVFIMSKMINFEI